MKHRLKIFKRTPLVAALNEYILSKTTYQNAVKKGKKDYWYDTTWKIAEAKSSNAFWLLLRKSKLMKRKCEHIDKTTWESYLKLTQLNNGNLLIDKYFYNQNVDELDACISRNELEAIIKKSRNKTAPGKDN